MILFLLSCAQEVPKALLFEARYGVERFACKTMKDGQSMTDLRLFISDVKSEGVSLMTSSSRWQTDRVALLDFEDGSEGCHNGTSEMNQVIWLKQLPKKGESLTFNVGIPFELNHQDPVQAAGPLRNMAMHWSWKGGYKFIRMGVRGENNEPYLFHLGSTLCSGEMTAVTSCKNPNLVSVKLERFDPEKAVIFDIKQLVSARLPGDEKWGCMSDHEDEGCKAIFETLDLWPSVGENTGVFRQ